MKRPNTLLPAVALLWAGAAMSHPGGYLNIEGIKGLATQPEYLHWIKLTSFSWDYPPDHASAGNTGGYWAQIAPPASGPGTLIVSKPVADQIPELQALCHSQKHFPDVTFVHNRDSLPRVYYVNIKGHEIYPQMVEFRLKDVVVRNCMHVKGAPAEVMRFDFKDIEWRNLQPPKELSKKDE